MKKTKILPLLLSLFLVTSCTTVRLTVTAPDVIAPVSLSNYVSLNKNENIEKTNDFSLDAFSYKTYSFFYTLYYYMSERNSKSNNLIQQRMMDLTEGSKYNALKNINIEARNSQSTINILFCAIVTKDTINVEVTGDVVKLKKEDSK